MSSRYIAVAKFVGARINVVVTDTQPAFKSDITVSSWTTVQNIDGSNHFMRDGGGWDFLPHGNKEFCEAVYAAARPLKLELAYVTKLRAKVDTLPMETLDTYRRFGETYGPDPIIADMTGDELVDLCEGEITARYVAAHAEAV